MNEEGDRRTLMPRVWKGFHWLVLPVGGLFVLGGMGGLVLYEMKAGPQKAAPTALNSTSKTSRGPDLPSLLVFMHPMCPCTNATVSELEKIRSSTAGKLKITMFVSTPEIPADAWLTSPTVERARAIQGVQVEADRGGFVAHKFGAMTSGFTVLYDQAGKKVFQGGITSSRGHEGDCAGTDTINQFVLRGTVPTRRTPVYGCALGSLGAQ